MKNTLVIRIENENGLGIFHGGGYNKLPAKLKKKSQLLWDNFPCPVEEFRKYVGFGEFCAFSSIKKFKETIPQDVLDWHINEQNYKVYLLKLKNYINRGKHQTIFEEEHIEEKIDITSFLGLDFEIKNSTFTVKI
jgi:argonaute-like protein implicated in RNA metabolism and viral defense